MKSDWKIISAMVPQLRERFLVEHNAKIVHMLTDASKTETERFWDAKEEMERVARMLRDCLDGRTRNNLQERLLLMKRVGMIKDEEIAELSEELQEWVERVSKLVFK